MMSGLKIQAPGFCNKFSVIQTNYHVKVIIKLCEVLNVFRLLLLCSIELVPNAFAVKIECTRVCDVLNSSFQRIY